MQTQYLLPLVGLFIAACGSDMMAPPSMYAAGFNPPPPNPGEIVYTSPIFKNLTPGTDETLCTYLDQYFDSASDVTNFRVFQAVPGHHMIVFAAKHKRPLDTHPCTDDDMVNSQFVAAGGADYNSGQALFNIPDGLAFRIAAGSQIMLQTHWLNATPNTYDGQGVAYLSTAPASPNKQALDLFTVVKTDFTIPAGQTATATTTCQVKNDVSLYSLTGHAHQWGSRVEISVKDDPASAANMLWGHDWVPEYQSNPPINFYSVSQPLVLKAGQTVTVNCTWRNTTPKDIQFPTEMCVGTGFYFPGHGEIDCENGDWSGGSQ